jgi:hypothetical protein
MGHQTSGYIAAAKISKSLMAISNSVAARLTSLSLLPARNRWTRGIKPPCECDWDWKRLLISKDTNAFGSKAGGVSNGKPGERPEYTKGYYAAFVIDPLGNNIEAMHWSPVWLKAMKLSPYVLTAITGAGLSVAFARYFG